MVCGRSEMRTRPGAVFMKKNQRRADAKKSLNNIRGFLFGLGVNIADRIREKFPEKDRKVKRITQEERNAIVMRQRLIIGVIAALVLLYLARTKAPIVQLKI